jgi:beta-galactosidase
MRKIYLTAILLGAVSALFAQTRNLDEGWMFLRLDGQQVQTEIRNQGSDWSSQYNIQHVGTSGVLAVSSDTLASEAERMKSGGWEQVTLPHTPKIEPLTVLHQWQGVCYYRRKLVLSKDDAGKQLWLEFEGAMSLADIWINGQHVSQHAGGYTSFVVDATGLLSAEHENEILVRLDNRDNALVPPGKPLAELDFCYYGGLYRDVRLIVKPKVYITHPLLANRVAGGGVFVRYPRVTEQEADVDVQTEVCNGGGENGQFVIRQTLLDGRKNVCRQECLLEIGSGQHGTSEQTLKVEQPRLWSTESPHLYTLRTEVLDVNHKVIDSQETRIGIRRIEMTATGGFVLNGKPLRLVGTNRHQEYPYVGNALPDNAQWRDVWQMRNNGFNIVRLGHYPQDPSVLDACDELGLLAIEAIPGWQFYNKDTTFVNLTYRNVREMIRRDRNHPSVVMWETTLNESWPPNSWKDQAVRTAHEEYPGDQCFTSGDTYGYSGFDVCYNDWEEGFHRPAKSPKPAFIREYYDYEFGGHYSTTRIGRGDGEKALMQNAWNAQWSHNRYRKLYPHTMGDAVWSMYDYNRGCCDNICKSGVADIFRLPKYSLAFYRTQVAAGSAIPQGKMPYEVFAATRWTKESVKPLVVYGNVEEVELELNGHKIARQRADRGEDTEYVQTPDGGNCKQLNFPPFTFKNVDWEAGTLKVIGYVGGHKVATETVRTPQTPEHLSIGYFEEGRPAAKRDLIIVYVRLEDKNGTLCPINGEKITLTVEGGKIMGPETVETEAGVASFLVRTGDDGKLRLNGYLKSVMPPLRSLRLQISTSTISLKGLMSEEK